MSKKILLKRSNQKESNGQPKLPLSSQIDYGELAINYAKDAETLAIKNSENEIVTFNKINIVQTSGSSASNVMSQNAVTTELNKKANKATTLAGYGITDAKIEDGSITIGKETIKPLTSVPSEYVTDDELSAKGYQTASQVSSAISNLVDSAPETLNTLNELAAALGDDPNFATTITNQIAQKADASDLDNYATTEALTSGLAGKANTSHTHTIANITDLQDALDDKADTSDLGNYATTEALTSGLAGKANTSHTHNAAQISGLTANRALVSDSSGVLSSSAITSTELGYLDGVTSNIQTQLNNKASLNHTHTIANITNLQTTLNGKANTSHTHTIANITDLQDALNDKADTSDLDNYATTTALTSGLAGKANTSHTHTTSQITNLSTTLSDYATTEALTSGLAGKANTSHTHTIANITNLQTTLNGKANTSHTHTIANITDLQDALDDKADASDLDNYATTAALTSGLAGKANTSHTHTVAQINGLSQNKLMVSDASGHPSVLSVTSTEASYLSGVTSNIQMQLNGKAATGHGHIAAQISGLTAKRALVSDGSGVVSSSNITDAELGYLDGVSSNIQTQLNQKADNSTTLESMLNYYKFIHSAQNVQSGSLLSIPATNFNHLYQWTLPDVSTALLITLPGDWFSDYDAMADYYGWDIVIMINNSNTSSKTISFNTMNPNLDANLIRVSDTFTVESKAQMYITLRFGNRFMFVEYNNQKKTALIG